MSAITEWRKRVDGARKELKAQEKRLFKQLEEDAKKALIESVLDVMKKHPRLLAVRFSSHEDQEYGTYFSLAHIKVEGRKKGLANTDGGEEGFEEIPYESQRPGFLKPIVEDLEKIVSSFDRGGFYPAPSVLLERAFDAYDKCVAIDRDGVVTKRKAWFTAEEMEAGL